MISQPYFYLITTLLSLINPVLLMQVNAQPQRIKVPTPFISEEAQKCGGYFVNHRWLGGTLTNWSTVQNRVEYLKELKQKEESGELARLPKKEAALLRREYEKLQQNLGGLTEMKQVPDIAIVVDPKRESTAIAECRKLGITIISILDTNSDPNMVDIPIPANDDAVRSIKLIISTLSDAVIKGKQASF